MISGLLELLLVGLLELPGVPIVVAEGILLIAFRPDLCRGARGALLLLNLVLPSIYHGPAILSSTDDSFTFTAHDLASRIRHLVVLGDSICTIAGAS